MRGDRHGRVSTADRERRRRPSDGFRTASRRRFTQLLAEALAALPGPVAAALATAEIRVTELPPPGELSIAVAEVDGDTVVRLRVHRRPAELRAADRLDLVGLLRAAVGREVADVLGLDVDEDWDELDEG